LQADLRIVFSIHRSTKGNQIMKILRHRASLIITLLIASSAWAAYVGRPEIKVSLTGMVERDHQMVQLEKAGLLNPGEILHWTITSQNAGSAPAHHYKTVGEISSGTAFVAGSARADKGVSITYSIDGGKTYETKPMLTQKQPDGSLRKIPAPTSLYTQVRYEWDEPLSEGRQVSASYLVRVK
jgi:uncharacterized repeat protein (TIGR01451 family)